VTIGAYQVTVSGPISGS